MTNRERDCLSSSLRGLFQGGNVDLVHFHHRFNDAIRLPGIRIGQHVAEKDWVDLPRETEFVLEPAAPPGRSAIGGKFLPEIIDLILGLAVDCERDRFGKLELRSTVERHELDSVERKLHRHDRSWRPANFFRRFFWITGNLPDLRILKNADVEFSCLLRFRIEPKKRIYLLHAISLGGFQPGRKYELCSSPLHLAFWLSLAYSRSAQQIYAPNSKQPVLA